jgi:hypothetical protein
MRERRVQERHQVDTAAQAARAHQLPPTLIRRWPHEHWPYPDHVLMGNGHLEKDEARLAELERLMGQVTMDHAR